MNRLSLWLVLKLADYFMVQHGWHCQLTHFVCWMGGLAMPVMLMKDGFEQIPADGLLYLLGLSAIY